MSQPRLLPPGRPFVFQLGWERVHVHHTSMCPPRMGRGEPRLFVLVPVLRCMTAAITLRSSSIFDSAARDSIFFSQAHTWHCTCYVYHSNYRYYTVTCCVSCFFPLHLAGDATFANPGVATSGALGSKDMTEVQGRVISTGFLVIDVRTKPSEGATKRCVCSFVVFGFFFLFVGSTLHTCYDVVCVALYMCVWIFT